jgi:uncharacterized protein YndB with AHSA1/START domain
VFEAFVDPDITRRFWFTKSSGRLEPDKEVTWWWEMYGASAPVFVKAVDPDRRILIVAAEMTRWADSRWSWPGSKHCSSTALS